MLNPDVLVRYYGLPTERVTNNPGSKTAPTWKAVKRPNGTTDYIEQPSENTYEKSRKRARATTLQAQSRGWKLETPVSRLRASYTPRAQTLKICRRIS